MDTPRLECSSPRGCAGDAPQVPVAIVGAGRLRPDRGADAARRRRRLRGARARRRAARLHRAVLRASSRRRARACSAQPGHRRQRRSASPPTSRPRPTARRRRTWWQRIHRGHRPGAGRAASSGTACSSSCCDGFLYPGHSALRMHAVPQRTGAALMAALRRAADARRHRGDHAGAGARAVGGRRKAACSASATCAPTARIEQLRVRRGAAGLQRLRRQRGEWCASCCPRCATPSSPATRQRRQRHRLGPGARRAPGRPGRLPGPRLVGGAAGRADVLGLDDGRRRAGQRARAGASTTRRRATPRRRCRCWRSRAAWPGTCSTTACWRSPAAFPISAMPRPPARCGTPPTRRRWRALIGCDARLRDAGSCAGRSRRTDAVRARAVAALHAVKVTGALFHTQGGLDIDAQMPRAARSDGTPLPNLLAAGGAARGVSGNAVWGYLSGNGLLSAVAGGAIAAHDRGALDGSQEYPMTLKQRLSSPRRAARARRLRRASAHWSPSRPASRRCTCRAPRSPTRGSAAPTSA